MTPSLDLPAPPDPLSLTPKQWRAIFGKLERYARKRLRTGCHERARDLAQDALAQVCAGRFVERGGVPRDATFLLCGAVNGLAMNERRRRYHTREVPTDDADLAMIGNRETPEDVVIAQDERARIFGALHARFAKDAVGAQIVDLFERGVFDAADQAEAAHLPINEIRNGRRRVLGYAEALCLAPQGPCSDAREAAPAEKRKVPQGVHIPVNSAAPTVGAELLRAAP
jgi:DNA-directed RNA polymerase specialized sigma24 family protein